HQEEASTIRMMFEWLAEERRSLRSITRELRALGLRPSRSQQWAKSSVARILGSELYVGRAFFNRRQRIQNPRTGRQGTGRRFRPEEDWIPVPVPAIVSEELFDRAQQQLAQNRERVRHEPRHPYLLRGLLRCGRCGRRYNSTPSHGRPFYRCAGRDGLVG